MKTYLLAELKTTYKVDSKIKEQPILSSSTEVFNYLISIWPEDINYIESFCVLILNKQNRVIGYKFISNGGTTCCIVDIKVLLSLVLTTGGQNIIVAHNHPTGNLKPSMEDINITNKIKDASNLLDIKLLDHLIVTENNGHYSFADNGEI